MVGLWLRWGKHICGENLISVYLNPQKGPSSVDITLRFRVKERGQGGLGRESSLSCGIKVLCVQFQRLGVFHIHIPVACYNLQNNFKYIRADFWLCITTALYTVDRIRIIVAILWARKLRSLTWPMSQLPVWIGWLSGHYPSQFTLFLLFLTAKLTSTGVRKIARWPNTGKCSWASLHLQRLHLQAGEIISVCLSWEFDVPMQVENSSPNTQFSLDKKLLLSMHFLYPDTPFSLEKKQQLSALGRASRTADQLFPGDSDDLYQVPIRTQHNFLFHYCSHCQSASHWLLTILTHPPSLCSFLPIPNTVPVQIPFLSVWSVTTAF